MSGCGALALLALLGSLGGRGCWGSDPGPGDPDGLPGPPPRSLWEAHRHKRSWVWNQFFVLEEYTGNEPLYVGKHRRGRVEHRQLQGTGVGELLGRRCDDDEIVMGDDRTGRHTCQPV
ncbi:hypothetical protein NHX12_021772 [Muraenolepis orangiensis]|uniref:Uncharacterized protein n=1 Tax=Muraenolepis orangiensis TaxID=630683 RepID=A0A9Q0IVV8_9TELE|nr:hypothetical protein NHX12_021772 [Muraenolepis orangiensis]